MRFSYQCNYSGSFHLICNSHFMINSIITSQFLFLNACKTAIIPFLNWLILHQIDFQITISLIKIFKSNRIISVNAKQHNIHKIDTYFNIHKKWLKLFQIAFVFHGNADFVSNKIQWKLENFNLNPILNKQILLRVSWLKILSLFKQWIGIFSDREF